MRASRPSLLLRLRESRRTSLTVFGVSLGALLVAAVWFTSARSDLAEAYGLVGSRQQALAAANQRMQEAQLRVKLADGAGELLARAEGEGLVEQAWGERLINVGQAPLTRQEVNDLLAGVARSEGRIFGAEAFELSVTRADEGLFDMPGQRTPPLLLTLRGTLLFRTQVPGIAGGAP
ncbi:MAG TPA: hypothetical protein VM576_07920 [Xanthomonadaceae bacterium]|nr:hypothetical protein [Xanthomonadaceae bacterium]